MVFVTVAIVGVWAALLGTAYLSRTASRDRRVRFAAVSACYLCLAAVALTLLGIGINGALGVAGMLLPYAAALTLALARRT